MGVLTSVARLFGAEATPTDNRTQFEVLAQVALRTSNAVIITNEVGHIEWVNDAFFTITGYTLDEVKGRKPGHFLQGPDTDPQTVARIAQKLRNQQPVQGWAAAKVCGH
jgi:methyl-accepting chemotaxis protein